MRQFIERVGLYFEQYEVSRIGGRIIGLLLVAGEPLSLDDIAAALDVSRASVSTNVRMAVTYGMAELVTKPGDRRDYYRWPANAWDRGLVINVEAVIALRRIAEQGLAAAEPDDTVARERLDELEDFCDFCRDEMQGMLDRWRARQRSAAAHSSETSPVRGVATYDGHN
jgi:DNA-binding transcriptional regulator GbsR (MarR family)